MGTPKKPIKKKTVAKATGAKKVAEEPIDPKKKKIIEDDDEDEDFDIGLDDELGGYESFDAFEEEDDF